MRISAAVARVGFSAEHASIDRKIQALLKRKKEILQKMADVVNGDDEQKIKEEKIKALRMELEFIDLEIQQLLRKKREPKKAKDPAIVNDRLPPSPSDLIQPRRSHEQIHASIDIKM